MIFVLFILLLLLCGKFYLLGFFLKPVRGYWGEQKCDKKGDILPVIWEYGFSFWENLNFNILLKVFQKENLRTAYVKPNIGEVSV